MISKKTAKSNQSSRSKCATTRQRRGMGNKKTGAANLSKRETPEPTPVSRKDSKQQLCLNLMCRAEGASIEDLQEVTGWQAHSVRGVPGGSGETQAWHGFGLGEGRRTAAALSDHASDRVSHGMRRQRRDCG